MEKEDKIFTRECFALNAMTFLAFSTIAIFFDYYQYLKSLPINPQRFGLLIGIFSVSSLVLRPLLSFTIRPSNAKHWITWCGIVLIAILLLYETAVSFWWVLIVRVVHGAAYVGLVTAVVTLLVKYVPRERSGQAFAFFSVVTLLPFAVIPPVIQCLSLLLGSFTRVLDLSGLLLILMFPLAALIRKDHLVFEKEEKSLGLREVMENLRSFEVIRALILMLLVWTAFAPVFFFLQAFGSSQGIANPGLFFTLSTFSEIGVRVAAGKYLDKTDKTKILGLSCAWLTVCYVLLAHLSETPVVFLSLGVCFGLGWGFAMPLLNGIIFDVSEDRFRPFNTNLGMQMSQAGFFVGPSLGGILLVHCGYGLLFYGCGALTVAALLMALAPVRRRSGVGREQ